MAISFTHETSRDVVGWQAAVQDPDAVDLTIPATCEAVLLLYYGYLDSSTDHLGPATLNGQNPDWRADTPGLAGNTQCTGALMWRNPTTGAQALDVLWESAPSVSGGATMFIAIYLEGAEDADPRAYAGDVGSATDPISAAVATEDADARVFRLESRFTGSSDQGDPPLEGGWTNINRHWDGAFVWEDRTSWIAGDGGTITANGQNESYSALAVVSIDAAPAGGGTDLVVQEASHGHNADSPALVQQNTLAAQDAAHAHTADAPALVQQNTLAAQEAAHAHQADSPALTQASTLQADEASHAHAADGLDLTQAGQLVAQEASHAHQADSPALTQAHNLQVDQADHGHQADNVVLTVGGLTLSINEALHAHTVEQLQLVQAHVLVVAGASHGHVADQLQLAQDYALQIQGANHAHLAEQLDLDQAQFLQIQAALHSHLADAPALTQQSVLVISDALHAHLAGNLVFDGTVFWADRVLIVRRPDRIVAIAPTDRIVRPQ